MHFRSVSVRRRSEGDTLESRVEGEDVGTRLEDWVCWFGQADATVFECSSSFSDCCCIADGVMDERSFDQESALLSGFYIGNSSKFHLPYFSNLSR